MKILKLLLKLVKLCIVIGIIVVAINIYIMIVGGTSFVDESDAPHVQAVIVPGALMRSTGPSDMLKDRLDMAYKLYSAGTADKILVSGDHGTDSYDEPNGMREYLMELGVPREDIFMDHAGFDTYDTMIRAKEVFLVESAIVSTQKYHLYRAVYIGKRIGMDTYGVDAQVYKPIKLFIYKIREMAARTKAFLDTDILKSRPKYDGTAIPITGDGSLTDDGLS